MNFAGCSEEMKQDAENYLLAAYKADWSPTALAKAEAEVARLNGVEVKEPKKKSTIFFRPKKKVKSGFMAMMSLLDSMVEDSDEDEMVDEGEEVEDDDYDDEVNKYFALPQLPYSKDGKDTDILEWWRVRQFDLPNLAKMARQFLSMPASSAGPERLFHTAGRLHDDLKKSAGEGTIGLMLEVHQNL